MTQATPLTQKNKNRTTQVPTSPPSLATWATINQAAQHVGVSSRTIQRWIITRGAPAAQIGGTTRIDLQMLDEWLRTEALRLREARQQRRSALRADRKR
jgi:excisionase family DNA binding protein